MRCGWSSRSRSAVLAVARHARHRAVQAPCLRRDAKGKQDDDDDVVVVSAQGAKEEEEEEKTGAYGGLVVVASYDREYWTTGTGRALLVHNVVRQAVSLARPIPQLNRQMD